VICAGTSTVLLLIRLLYSEVNSSSRDDGSFSPGMKQRSSMTYIIKTVWVIRSSEAAEGKHHREEFQIEDRVHGACKLVVFFKKYFIYSSVRLLIEGCSLTRESVSQYSFSASDFRFSQVSLGAQLN
jgi:hypothetical protein